MTTARDVILHNFNAQQVASFNAILDFLVTNGPDSARLELAALLNPWRPQFQHKKRGSDYQQIGVAVLQTDKPISDEEVLIVYKGKDGKLWARPVYEFHDGRFEPLPATPSEDKA